MIETFIFQVKKKIISNNKFLTLTNLISKKQIFFNIKLYLNPDLYSYSNLITKIYYIIF